MIVEFPGVEVFVKLIVPPKHIDSGEAVKSALGAWEKPTTNEKIVNNKKRNLIPVLNVTSKLLKQT